MKLERGNASARELIAAPGLAARLGMRLCIWQREVQSHASRAPLCPCLSSFVSKQPAAAI